MGCCQPLGPEKVEGAFNDFGKNLNSVPSANGTMLGSDRVKFVLRKSIKREAWQRGMKDAIHSLRIAVDRTVLIVYVLCCVN